MWVAVEGPYSSCGGTIWYMWRDRGVAVERLCCSCIQMVCPMYCPVCPSHSLAVFCPLSNKQELRCHTLFLLATVTVRFSIEYHKFCQNNIFKIRLIKGPLKEVQVSISILPLTDSIITIGTGSDETNF